LWTMRQFSGFGMAADTNERFHYLLSHGQTGLSVAFHLPTLMGYDSDHPMSEGEVGKCGVAIDSLADMETLFDGLPLDKISTSMTTNAPAVILWSMYLVVAERQGADWAKSMVKRPSRRSRRNCWRNSISTSGSSSTTRISRFMTAPPMSLRMQPRAAGRFETQYIRQARSRLQSPRHAASR